MNNRIEEMNNFIKHYAKVFEQNPTITIDEDFFYSQLVWYKMSSEEINNPTVRENFDYWTNMFADNKNIKVFVSEKQKSFCQFHNMDYSDKNINYVKMYLTFEKNDLRDCVSEIFKFIAENNMTHGSKASEKQRADSVVLRVKSMEDAEKVSDFVKKSPQISSKLRKVNPFLFNEFGIGYAADGKMSFNMVLSNQLANYFNSLKLSNNLRNATIQEFRNYVTRVYNSTFVSGETLETFMNESIFNDHNDSKENPEEALNNCGEILKLIIETTSQNADINTFKKHHQYCNDEERIKNHGNFYKNKIKLLDKETEITKNTKETNLTKDIFDAFCSYAIGKYGFKDALEIAEDYTKRGVSTVITRDNNFRSMFENYVTINSINTILSGNTMKAYFQKFNKINKVELLDQAAMATCSKYDYKQLNYAIHGALTSNNFIRFTESGQNMYRTKLVEHITSAGLADVIKESLSEKGIVCPIDDIYFSCYTNYIANKIAELENIEKVI